MNNRKPKDRINAGIKGMRFDKRVMAACVPTIVIFVLIVIMSFCVVVAFCWVVGSINEMIADIVVLFAAIAFFGSYALVFIYSALAIWSKLQQDLKEQENENLKAYAKNSMLNMQELGKWEALAELLYYRATQKNIPLDSLTVETASQLMPEFATSEKALASIIATAMSEENKK